MWIRLLKDQTTASIKRALAEIIGNCQPPGRLRSDNASNLNSRELGEFLNVFNIEHRNSSPGNSRGNSPSESAIKRIQTHMRALQPPTDDVNLSIALSLIALRLNTEPLKGQKYTPFETHFGRRSTLTRQLPQFDAKTIDTLSTPMKRAIKHLEKIQVDQKNAT